MQKIDDDTSCKHEAERLSMPMNRTINPCIDFHSFTCGNYDKVFSIRPLSSTFGSTEERNYQIDRIYHAALKQNNEEDIEPIRFIKSAYQLCIEGKAFNPSIRMLTQP